MILSWKNPADTDFRQANITWTGGTGTTTPPTEAIPVTGTPSADDSYIVTGLLAGSYSFTITSEDVVGNISGSADASPSPIARAIMSSGSNNGSSVSITIRVGKPAASSVRSYSALDDPAHATIDQSSVSVPFRVRDDIPAPATRSAMPSQSAVASKGSYSVVPASFWISSQMVDINRPSSAYTGTVPQAAAPAAGATDQPAADDGGQVGGVTSGAALAAASDSRSSEGASGATKVSVSLASPTPSNARSPASGQKPSAPSNPQGSRPAFAALAPASWREEDAEEAE